MKAPKPGSPVRSLGCRVIKQLAVVPIRLLPNEVTPKQSGAKNALLRARMVFCKTTVPRLEMPPLVCPELPLRVLLVMVTVPAFAMAPGA